MEAQQNENKYNQERLSQRHEETISICSKLYGISRVVLDILEAFGIKVCPPSLTYGVQVLTYFDLVR